MKYESDFDKKITFEEMQDSPISYLKNLDLASVFQISGRLYFFFEGWKKNKKRMSRAGYFLVVHNSAPYRLMEEDVAYGTVWKYTSSKKKTYKRKNGEYCKVYKLWGTPYIKEMNTRGTYSNFKEDIDGKLCQIMIITEDETIEIVNPNMDWVKYNPKRLKETLNSLIKEIQE